MVTHYTLTLDGTAQRLSQVYSTGAGNAQPSAAQDIPFRQVFLGGMEGNANTVFIGATSAVSSTNHGASLAASVRLSLGPFAGEGPIKLSDIWAIGTNTQRLAILAVPF